MIAPGVGRDRHGAAVVAGTDLPIWKIDFLMDCGESPSEISTRYGLEHDEILNAIVYAANNPLEMACEMDYYYGCIWQVHEQERVRTNG